MSEYEGVLNLIIEAKRYEPDDCESFAEWLAYYLVSHGVRRECTATWQLCKEDSSDNRTRYWRCSFCKGYRFHNGEMRKKYKYCPNCGAKILSSEGK